MSARSIFPAKTYSSVPQRRCRGFTGQNSNGTFLRTCLSKLEKSYKKRTDGGEELQIDDLEIFENVAYVMAYHADPSIPKTIDEWLDQFEMFSIYQVLPQILELWGDNLMTDVQAKKGLAEASGK